MGVIMTRIVRKGDLCDLVDQDTDATLLADTAYGTCAGVQHFLARPEVQDPLSPEWKLAEDIRRAVEGG